MSCQSRKMLLAKFALANKGKALCVDCRGKGFDLHSKPGERHSRRCQRCRGAGVIGVGTTKR